MLTDSLLQSQSFINSLDERAHLYVNSHLWSKYALRYILLYHHLRATKRRLFCSNSLWKQMARMCLRIMLNLREFNSIPSSLFSHTITHCKCVCPCQSVTQVCMCVAWNWRKTTLCISYSPPSVAEKKKTTKQCYRKEHHPPNVSIKPAQIQLNWPTMCLSSAYAITRPAWDLWNPSFAKCHIFDFLHYNSRNCLLDCLIAFFKLFHNILFQTNSVAPLKG